MELKITFLEGVSISVEGYDITVKGPKGELNRRLMYPGFKFVLRENELILKSKEDKVSRKDKMFMNTYFAHIQNMMKGVTEGFSYKLKICSGHFPMSIIVEKNDLIVKNYLGEKVPRKAKLIGGVTVKVEGDFILLNGIDKEKVGQMAARIEQTAVVKNRDRRIFQDGCYIIEKADKSVV